MKARDGTVQVRRRAEALLAALSALVPGMQRRALDLDRTCGFPGDDIEALRSLGALAAPVPTSLGGLGMGTEPAGAADLLAALRLIGRGSLSVGRIFEAHVNALRLIVRYGTQDQASSAAEAALAGHLFGLWVTDAPDAPLQLSPDGTLHGCKCPCSAAGHATRAVVTALTERGHSLLVVVRLTQGERADRSGWDPHGMRATASGRMSLDGIRVSESAVIGSDEDYLREPDFSVGAWRTAAVTLGGLEALVAQTRCQLVARERQDDPHQQSRIGEALIAQETARLWITQAAHVGEAADGDPDDSANYVNLARLAAEAACLDAIRLAQRSLGMPAFRHGNIAELLFRDLGMYLRQPAPDMALTDAAGHFMQRDLPTPPA